MFALYVIRCFVHLTITAVLSRNSFHLMGCEVCFCPLDFESQNGSPKPDHYIDKQPASPTVGVVRFVADSEPKCGPNGGHIFEVPKNGTRTKIHALLWELYSLLGA